MERLGSRLLNHAPCQVMILNKTDLLPYVDFDVARSIDNARQVNPDIAVIQLSARAAQGLDGYQWVTRPGRGDAADGVRGGTWRSEERSILPKSSAEMTCGGVLGVALGHVCPAPHDMGPAVVRLDPGPTILGGDHLNQNPGIALRKECVVAWVGVFNDDMSD